MTTQTNNEVEKLEESLNASSKVETLEELEILISKVKKAQKIFSTYSQEKVDAIFKAAAIAANKARIPLAKMAVEETGMGIVEDKVIKNHYAAEYIYNKYRDTKTCGVIEEDKQFGIKKIAEPIGLIAAVIPTTNPTSTVIFKTLISLKTRNGIIISPHPRAKNSTIAAAKIVLEAAVKAGAPEGIISWIDVPSLELTNLLMQSADIILATGGPGMVKSAYSSGKPALGVGPGNVPCYIEKSAKLKTALSGYLLCSLFIFLSFVAVHMFYKKTGSLAEFISRQYNYNSILCLTASVFLFLTFQNIRIPEGRAFFLWLVMPTS